MALMLCSSSSRAQDADWDSPAIKVFPDHNRVALNPALLPQLIDQGRQLFEAKFNELDGAGRPGATGDSKPTPRNPLNNIDLVRTSGPDAMACVSCHNQPTVGGSGDFVANAFVGAHFSDPPTNRIDSGVTNERNTTSISGAGLIEILAKEMTRELRLQRANALDTAKDSGTRQKVTLSAKGVHFGVIVALPDGTVDAVELEGVDYDLVVRPFGVKGVAASLREFTIAALNQHHGIQAIERFGWERTGRKDFDSDGVAEEFSIDHLTALVAFQAQLAPPKRSLSEDRIAREVELRGEELFEKIGCVSCHIPSLPVASMVFQEPNEYNRPGAVTPEDVRGTVDINLRTGGGNEYFVEAYTDLKRHNLCDNEITHFGNEKHKQDNVDTRLFLTAKLWDVATSAPYGHRGDLRTVSKAILSHGGEARQQRERFLRLPNADKKALIAFLCTLGRGK
jgi:cytochrome c peroxidase